MRKFPSRRIAAAALAIAAAGSLAAADVITDWNEVYIDTIRDEGGKPCPISRAGAMLHAAMYDAVNSIERTHEPYLTLADAPAGASREAAAAAAGHRVMTHLYPARTSVYDAALEASLAAVPPGPGRDAGVALGLAVADALIEERATDGTQTEPPYEFGSDPGHYRPTWPDFTEPPYNPGWGSTEPWTMIDGKQFRPLGPAGHTEMAALLASPEYTADFDEVNRPSPPKFLPLRPDPVCDLGCHGRGPGSGGGSDGQRCHGGQAAGVRGLSLTPDGRSSEPVDESA